MGFGGKEVVERMRRQGRYKGGWSAGRVNRRTWDWLEWLRRQELENAGRDMTEPRSQSWTRNEFLGKLVCDGSRIRGVLLVIVFYYWKEGPLKSSHPSPSLR